MCKITQQDQTPGLEGIAQAEEQRPRVFTQNFDDSGTGRVESPGDIAGASGALDLTGVVVLPDVGVNLSGATLSATSITGTATADVNVALADNADSSDTSSNSADAVAGLPKVPIIVAAPAAVAVFRKSLRETMRLESVMIILP